MKKNVFQDLLIKGLSASKDRIAIESGTQSITYDQLDKRTDYIANWLVNRCTKPGTFIGIMVEDRVEFIFLLIGILKAGCVFVPLDPTYPDSRLKEMIDTTDLSLVIIDNKNQKNLKSLGPDSQSKPVEFIPSPLQLHSDQTRSQIPYSPEDKIYVYFTSGTSGKPRAIVGKNKSLLHFINWEIETFPLESGGFRVSQLIAPGFDASLRDIFVPLCSGGCLCIPETKEVSLHAESLANWLHQSRVHLIHCVPAVFRFLTTASLIPDYFPELKYILLSGEKIHPFDLAPWYDIFGDRVQLVNLYGPTETTMVKTFYFIRESDLHREKIPIGKAMKGSRVMVCSDDMQTCDELETGEIYIRTPFRTFGYYKDPGLNRERFIKNPFTGDPDDILYRTGDLGKYQPDGNIELVGRIDRQVKIRGIRVELEEIEYLLLKHPSVKEAAVVKEEISPGYELLAAYIIGTSSGDVREENLITSLKRYLAQKVPDYMVPDKIIKMGKIPVTPNGKVDYRALAVLPADRSQGLILPSSPIEKKLLEIWANILPVDAIDVTSNFFELGGNSLNVMALLSQIYAAFDVRIPLGDIFENTTIRKQARLILQTNREQFQPIEPVESKEYYALSSAQKRLYFMHQIDETGKGCNLPMIRLVEGEIEKAKLENAFKHLIRRHQSFCTSFVMVSGELVQRTHRQVDFEIENYDIENFTNPVTFSHHRYNHPKPGKERGNIEKEIIQNFIQPFDLTTVPLLRVGLIKIEEKKHILMVDMHHIISDGVSHKIIVNDFVSIYSGTGLPRLKLQYNDYSEWQRGNRQQEELQEQEAWWLKQFPGGMPMLKLPYDFSSSAVQSLEGSQLMFEISAHQTTSLKKIAQSGNSTLYIVLLALYNILLAKITGQEDVIVGTLIAGRRHKDLEGVMGMFVNTLILRNFPQPETPFFQFLEEVRKRTIEAFENQEYPFEKLVEKITVNGGSGNSPIEALFFFFFIESRETSASPLKVMPYPLEKNVSMFSLILTAKESEIQGKIFFNFEYCTKLFSKDRIKRFISYFKEILECVVENTDIRLKDIHISHDFVDIETDNKEENQADFGF